MASRKKSGTGADHAVRVNVVLDIEGDWERDPLAAVEGIAEGLATLDRRLRDAVMVARGQGRSWAEIGERLGVSRQAAWDRFAND